MASKSMLFVRKFAAFLDLPPPFSADVIYGSPLTPNIEFGR